MDEELLKELKEIKDQMRQQDIQMNTLQTAIGNLQAKVMGLETLISGDPFPETEGQGGLM